MKNIYISLEYLYRKVKLGSFHDERALWHKDEFGQSSLTHNLSAVLYHTDILIRMHGKNY